MNIEAFDLFEEMIDCSICLEGIKEGQRALMITLCKHAFHQTCLDPWLLRNSTCPNCRSAIRPENEPTPLQRSIQQRELDRLYLTYVLYSWVLQKFNAVRFHQHTNAIHSFMNSFVWNEVRPISFNMTPRNRGSLSSIRALRGYIIQREANLFQELNPTSPHFALHRNPRVRQMGEQIQPQLTAFLATHS
jgi:hypothetical protein